MVQRAIYSMRQQVEAKLSRLPLSYFDRQPRGEILSRVTNDIDNLAQSLQQTMSQVVISLLTIVGVLAVMFWISWLLALIALVTVPASVFIVTRIGKRAQPQFIKQWKIDRQAQRPYRGDASPATRWSRYSASVTRLDGNLHRAEREAVSVQLPGPVHLGHDPAGDDVHGKLELRAGRRGRRRCRVAAGALSIGDVQAFIQYSRQFSQPLTQVASMANLLQSGVASAERVFALLDADEQEPDAAEPAEARRR